MRRNRPRAAGAHRLCRAPVARHADHAAGEDPRLEPFRERGPARCSSAAGQLDLSCAACHDDNWGRRLGGSAIPQAHPTGYPLYRLEWQALGSLQRRLRNCMTGVRAEPFAFGAPEFVDLELYLMSRARGMPIETPAVRPLQRQPVKRITCDRPIQLRP